MPSLIDAWAGVELVDELIKRGEETNAFEFISREQMIVLILHYNREHPDAPITWG